MRNYIYSALFFILLNNSCKAQNPILDIDTPKDNFIGVKGAYYKDTKNVLNGYDGTYLYTSGNTSLKIKSQKNIKTSMNNFYYEDLIVGEYQYIENGVEKVNTLSKLTSTSNNNSISGSLILTGTEFGCKDCKPDEKRLRLGITSSPNFGEMDVRKTTVNGKAAILVVFWWTGPIAVKAGDPMPKPAVIKAGTYTMIKQ
ncbi:DUF6705 family protein [Flavobacterium ginsengisoli]|uniref:DUF6705 family protein n=1 Tax=Flavobacterium ginsengisoli TaxID=871694 RepID=UPI002414E8C2|nr:DUF6705 family protein [Flavobacterium ginsengisoli]